MHSHDLVNNKILLGYWNYTDCQIWSVLYQTKLFWIDVSQQKINTSKLTQIILWLSQNLLSSTHTVETYFYMDHARKACITPCSTQKFVKSYGFIEKESHLECCFLKEYFMWWWILLSRFWQETRERLTSYMYLVTENDTLFRNWYS